jgi:VWFA-related protein
MLRPNSLIRVSFLLLFVVSAALLHAQTATAQTGTQGGSAVQGGVIPPLPENQQPANADKGATPPDSNSQQPADQGGVLPPLPDNQQPGNADKGTTPAGATPPAQQPASAGQSGQQQPSQPGGVEETGGGGYIIRKKVEEVVLHATVIDEHQKLILNLDKTAFTVFEDGKPQQITSFRHEDIPVALGIIIDNSGSMRDKRPAVNDAAINLVKSSNPQDEVFVVNFNDEYWLDQDFTGSIPKLQDALQRIEARGGTALYDAIVASAEHLKKSARLDKKVLLVVTDGEDNASRESLEQAIKRLQAENGPTVYTIGILDKDKRERRARRALQEMAEQTGGIAFFPQDLSEVDNISRTVAHDIRSQYTIGYRPTRSQAQGGYRMVRVEARARGYRKLQVRTRSGYYAGQERAAR